MWVSANDRDNNYNRFSFIFISFSNTGSGSESAITLVSPNARVLLLPPEGDKSDSSLNPVLASYKQYLQSIYSARALAPADKYLPTLEAPYINLAMIKKEHYDPEQRDEFTRRTLHGGVDQILRSKTPINIESLLTPDAYGDPVRFILVEGPPGIGKTTFAWEACRRWDEIESLRCYHTVVLLKLREKWVLNATTIPDLLRYEYNPEFTETISEEISKTNGQNLLLVLDGFDEVSHSFHENSVVIKIISKQILPKCTIILTTRPAAKYRLISVCQPKIDKHVEIIGFTEEERVRYITEVFSKQPELQANFLKYMFLVPHIKSMMYIPLNCAIIAQVYYESQSNLHLAIPRTRTQLYKALTHSLIVRHMRMKECHYENESMLPEGLNKNDMDTFNTLSRFAFYSYCTGMSRKVTFYKEDIPDEFVHFGFMNESAEMYATKGVQRTFSFLHLSLQEYLAAWHVANSYSIEFQAAFHWYAVVGRRIYNGKIENENALLSSLKTHEVLEQPAIFLAGITGQFQILSDSWKVYFGRSSTNVLLQSLYEAQNPALLPVYFSGNDSRRNISIGTSSSSSSSFTSCTEIQRPYDGYALSYCLVHSSDEFNLCFNLSREDDISLVETFVKGLDDHHRSTKPRVKQLKVKLGEQYSNKFLFWVAKASCSTALEEMELESISSLSSDLACTFIKQFCKVRCLYIHVGSFSSWKWLVVLKYLTELKVFHVSTKDSPARCDPGPDRQLEHAEWAEERVVDNDCMSIPSIKSLKVELGGDVESMQNSSNFLFWLMKTECLTELEEMMFTSDSSISSDLLYDFVRRSTKVKYLYAHIASQRSSEWLYALKFLRDLQGFYITNKNNSIASQVQTEDVHDFDPKWTAAVLDVEFPPTTQMFNVHSARNTVILLLLKTVLRSTIITEVVLPNISRETMAGVRSILLHCPSLTTLELKRTRLGYDGILYLCRALRNNTSLKHLLIFDEYLLPPSMEQRKLELTSFTSMDRVPLPCKTTCTDFLLDLNDILKDNTTLVVMKIESGLFLPLSAGRGREYCQWTGLGPLQQFNVGAVRSGMSPNLRRSFSSSDLNEPQTLLFWDRQLPWFDQCMPVPGQIDFKNLFSRRREKGKKLFSLPSFTAPDTEVLHSFSGLDPRLKKCLEISHIDQYVDKIWRTCWGMLGEINTRETTWKSLCTMQHVPQLDTYIPMAKIDLENSSSAVLTYTNTY